MPQLTIFHCVFCGNPRPDGRTDMQYCSNRCKQKAYRWRRRKAQYQTKALNNITDLASYLEYAATREQAISMLAKIISHAKKLGAQYNVSFKGV